MPGKARLITVIPACNSERTLPRTLASLAAQTVKPDRVLVVDYGSTDGTERVVAGFTALPCEWRRLPPEHSFFHACNTGLQLAVNTRHLHFLRPGDVLQPAFYEELLRALGDGDAFALAFCLEETRDAAGQPVWVAGRRRQQATVFSHDAFLVAMGRLERLPLSTALLRTGGRRVPLGFRVEISQLAHKNFWASFAVHCSRLVRVNQPLCAHQWEPPSVTEPMLPGMQPLVYDELRVMQNADHLRDERGGWWERQRRLWIFARRAALKARRTEQMQKLHHAPEIGRACRTQAGWLRWLPATVVIVLRDWLVFGLLRRKRHPQDLYR